MKKRNLSTLLLASLFLCSCAENPDSDIIVHKDMENLIGEAQQTDDNKADLEDLQQETHYTTEFENESLRVQVKVDADVDIPKVDKLSVYHVEKEQFTQQTVDALIAELFGDHPLYDFEAATLRTRASLLPELARAREALTNADENTPLSVLQDELDLLEAWYDYLPDTVDPTAYPSDGKLHPVKELYERNENAMAYHDAYYTKRYQQFPDGELLECTTDGADGDYRTLHIINSPDNASLISYSKTPLSAEFDHTSTELWYVLPNAARYGLPKDFRMSFDDLNADWAQLPGNTAALSQEAAEEQAEALFSALGISGIALYRGERFSEEVMLCQNMYSETHQRYYRTCWVLQYYPVLDGCMLMPDGGKSEGIDLYRRRDWENMQIEVRVDDSGIIGFYFISPTQILEKTVADAQLKAFPEIRQTFEKMLPMLSAPENENFRTKVDIDRIQLCYMRVAEKDSFDTGYAVPVWGFYGKHSDINNIGETVADYYRLQICINAIDGSVIVPGQGY